MKYDKQYFLAKFRAIPESLWYVGYFESNTGQKCALGHCGESQTKLTDEGHALRDLFVHIKSIPGNNDPVAYINDNYGHNNLFPHNTPKERIIAALKSLP